MQIFILASPLYFSVVSMLAPPSALTYSTVQPGIVLVSFFVSSVAKAGGTADVTAARAKNAENMRVINFFIKPLLY